MPEEKTMPYAALMLSIMSKYGSNAKEVFGLVSMKSEIDALKAALADIVVDHVVAEDHPEHARSMDALNHLNTARALVLGCTGIMPSHVVPEDKAIAILNEVDAKFSYLKKNHRALAGEEQRDAVAQQVRSLIREMRVIKRGGAYLNAEQMSTIRLLLGLVTDEATGECMYPQFTEQFNALAALVKT